MLQLAPTPENINTVRRQLAQFSCLAAPPELSATRKQDLAAALLWFSHLADYETLGVCTDTLDEAQTAAANYVSKLSRPIALDLPPRQGPVYLKFNTLKGAWYLDDYVGPSRGVLVSFHTTEPELDAVNGTYGPFPLDLFS